MRTLLARRAELKRKNKNAFTLIELVVVIVIVGVLAAIAAIAYNYFINSSEEEASLAEALDIANFWQAESALLQTPLYANGCSNIELVTDNYDAGGISTFRLGNGEVKELPVGTRAFAANNNCQPENPAADRNAPIGTITVDSNGYRFIIPMFTTSTGGGVRGETIGPFEAGARSPQGSATPTSNGSTVTVGDSTSSQDLCITDDPEATSYVVAVRDVYANSFLDESEYSYTDSRTGGQYCVSVSGLPAGPVYQIFITARNNVGQGATSVINLDSGDGTGTAGNPGPLTDLQVTGTTNDSVSLSWTPPTSTGGVDISGYRVSTSTDGGNTWEVVITTPLPTVTVPGLQPDTPYLFRVEVVNSAGLYSDPVDTSSPVTLQTLSVSAAGNVLLEIAGATFSCPPSHPEDNGDGTCRGYQDYQFAYQSPQFEYYTEVETRTVGGSSWPSNGLGCPDSGFSEQENGDCASEDYTVDVATVKSRELDPPSGWTVSDDGTQWVFKYPTPEGWIDDGTRYYQDADKQCPAGYPNLVDGKCYDYVGYDRLNYTYRTETYSYSYGCAGTCYGSRLVCGGIPPNCAPGTGPSWGQCGINGPVCTGTQSYSYGCTKTCTGTGTRQVKNGPPSGYYDNGSQYQRVMPSGPGWVRNDAELRYERSSDTGLDGQSTFVISADRAFWANRDTYGVTDMLVNGVSVGLDGVSDNLGTCSSVQGTTVEFTGSSASTVTVSSCQEGVIQ